MYNLQTVDLCFECAVLDDIVKKKKWKGDMGEGMTDLEGVSRKEFPHGEPRSDIQFHARTVSLYGG